MGCLAGITYVLGAQDFLRKPCGYNRARRAFVYLTPETSMTKTWQGLFVVIGSVFVLAAATWANFEAGKEACERGDDDTPLA